MSTTDRTDTRMLVAPLADLERALIEMFLEARGFDADTLDHLRDPERAAVLREASIAVSAKLAEIEARSHYLHELHE